MIERNPGKKKKDFTEKRMRRVQMWYVIWAGSSHLSKQHMHSFRLLKVWSGSRLILRGGFVIPHMLGFSSLLLGNSHFFSSTIPVAKKKPIKSTFFFFFHTQKVSGKEYEVTLWIN